MVINSPAPLLFSLSSPTLTFSKSPVFNRLHSFKTSHSFNLPEHFWNPFQSTLSTPSQCVSLLPLSLSVPLVPWPVLLPRLSPSTPPTAPRPPPLCTEARPTASPPYVYLANKSATHTNTIPARLHHHEPRSLHRHSSPCDLHRD